MKLIDCATLGIKESQVKSLDDFLGAFKIGRGYSVDTDAQETVIAGFQRIVDNKFTMLRNVPIEGASAPIPLILVGPSGVWVLYPSGLRGVFRAHGEAWEKMDNHQQTYKPSGENFLTQTAQMAKMVETYLASHGVRNPQIGAGVVFTNPGIHVEIVRPVVRVVLIDALDRFISGILQGRLIYDREEVENTVNLFTNPPHEHQEDTDDEGTVLEVSHQEDRNTTGQASLEKIDSTFSKVEKLPFTSKQWILLGALILINIVILVAFALFILLNT
jgi:hypothetical protein